MNFRIQIRGVREVQERFNAIGSRDLPITMAATLSRLASRAQRDIRENVLPQHFTLRRVAWARSGIRITPATKQKWEAAVMDINPYMELQETGGTKIPFGKFIAVPLRGARPTQSALIRRDNYPKAVLDNGGFIRDHIIYKVKSRVHKGSGFRGVSGVVPMYFLVERASIKPRYGFEPAVDRAVAHFPEEFEKAARQFMK